MTEQQAAMVIRLLSAILLCVSIITGHVLFG